MQETEDCEVCELVFLTKNPDAVLSKLSVLDGAVMPQCICQAVSMQYLMESRSVLEIGEA